MPQEEELASSEGLPEALQLPTGAAQRGLQLTMPHVWSGMAVPMAGGTAPPSLGGSGSLITIVGVNELLSLWQLGACRHLGGAQTLQGLLDIVSGQRQRHFPCRGREGMGEAGIRHRTAHRPTLGASRPCPGNMDPARSGPSRPALSSKPCPPRALSPVHSSQESGKPQPS